MARSFEALARQARDAHWPHENYLHEVHQLDLQPRQFFRDRIWILSCSDTCPAGGQRRIIE